MIDQPPLFDAALAGLGITAWYRYPDGWRLHVGQRREGETAWSRADQYEGLSTAEMLDVLSVVVDQLAEEHGAPRS